MGDKLMNWCIHMIMQDSPWCRLKGPRLSSQPYGQLSRRSTPELRAQLNLTNDHKKKESPYLQACPVPGILMLQLSAAGIARAILKRLSRLQANSDSEADRLEEFKPNGGQLFQHSLDRSVKTWKMTELFHYYINTNYSFKSVNSDIGSLHPHFA